MWWYFDNWFYKHGEMASIQQQLLDKKARIPPMLTDNHICDISTRGVNWMMAATHTYHRQTVLLPYAGHRSVRMGLRNFCHLNYWLIEPRGDRFADLCQDDTQEEDEDIYNINTMWHLDPLDWAGKFDPDGMQVDSLLINPPHGRAAETLMALHPFTKERGCTAAVIDASELLSPEREVFRRWAGKEGFTWGLLKDLFFAAYGDEHPVILFK